MMERVMTRERWIAAVGLMIGAVLMLPALSMIYDREPPVVVLSVEADLDEVPQGGQLIVRYTVERLRDCSQTTERTLWDGEGEQYRLDSSSRQSTGPLGVQSYRRVVPIPASAAAGLSRYRVVISYECNPMHRIWPIKLVVADIVFWIVVPPELPPPKPRQATIIKA